MQVSSLTQQNDTNNYTNRVLKPCKAKRAINTGCCLMGSIPI